jgi:hypothetical protein
MSKSPVLTEAQAAPRGVRPDRRASVRRACTLEALSRPLELSDAIAWGATVQDISAGGVGLLICYPFKPGTFLAVDLVGGHEGSRTVLVRVVHVTDQSDGTWFVGCEFALPLSEEEVAAFA